MRQVARTLTPEGQARLDPLRRHTSPEAFRAVVPGGGLIDLDTCLIVTADRRVLLESGFDHIRTGPTFPRHLFPPQHRAGRYMALVNQWSSNHFHWLLDTLPRASLLPLDEEPDTPVIVPAGLSSNQLDCLTMIGISRDRMVPFDCPHLVVDELVFPSFVGQPGYPPPWAVSWVRDHLVPEPARPRRLRRLWISRAGATRGRVTNEGAVMQVLSRYGFESIAPEKKPLTEQLRIFNSAEIIVAPHGAGLANLIGACDATVIELTTKRRWGNGCYYTLCDAVGLDYWYMQCGMTPARNLAIDLDVLQATVEAALGGSR